MAEAAWIATPAGRLHARRWPGSTERAPILLLHDSLGCVALWREFPAQLAEATGRAVVAYDRLGFGASDPHPGLLGPDFVREEAGQGLAAVIAHYRLQRFVLFGHSVGGGMAVAAAAQLGEGCEALVTVSAQAFVEQRTLDGVRAAKRQFAAPGQLERLQRHHGDKAAWVLAAWTDSWLSPAFAGFHLDDELAALRCPLLALHGEDDEYGSAAHPRRLVARAGADARLQLLPGCGHSPHREQSDWVLAQVAVFLR